MKPHQNKFYEPSKLQLQQQKMGDIYKMLNQQDKAMTNLLLKYQDKHTIDDQLQKQSRTIGYQVVRKRNGTQRNNQNIEKIKEISHIQLPLIESSYAKFQKNRSKQSRTLSKAKNNQKSLFENPYLAELDNEERSKKVDHIQKAYLKQRLKGSKSKSKLTSAAHSNKINRSRQKHRASEQLSTRQNPVDIEFTNEKRQKNFQQKQEVKLQNDLPIPLGYFKQNVEDESSSQEGDVPLSFYQRQYRQLIRSQCLQQTNFLYFSKNQAMKQWTQSLLLLFEKHDKQLVSLRKKCKYLQKFDENFFTIDIFKEE